MSTENGNKRTHEENDVIRDTVKEMFPNVPDDQIESAVTATEHNTDRPVRERFHSTVRRVVRKK